jgi:predicted SnoaL-like aldol condensation-catalyzing enzyme
MGNKLELLKRIYHDPESPGGFAGIERLFREAKKQDPSIKRADVKYFLDGDRTYTLHRPRRVRFKRARTIPSGLYTDIQCDLAMMDKFSRANRGYNYILLAVCVLSKRIWAIPVKTKQLTDMKEAFDQLLADIPITPSRIFSDRGKEFFMNVHTKYKEGGKTLTKTENYFDAKGIDKHWSSTKTIKAALAERYIRLLKSRLYRYMSEKRTTSWIDILPKIVTAINNSPSRITGMRPNDINFKNAQDVWERVYEPYLESAPHKKQKFKKGDHVRMANYKEVFDRGYLPNWSDEILEVDSVKHANVDTYKVKDETGEEFKGRFYAEDLGRTRKDTTYRIEKVFAKRKTKEGTQQIKVKFIGYPKLFWINESDLVI